MKQLFEKILQAWPVIVALVGICATWYVQINMLEYRLTTLEKEVLAIRTSYSEKLDTINSTIMEMKLDIRTLVTLMRAENEKTK